MFLSQLRSKLYADIINRKTRQRALDFAIVGEQSKNFIRTDFFGCQNQRMEINEILKSKICI